MKNETGELIDRLTEECKSMAFDSKQFEELLFWILNTLSYSGLHPHRYREVVILGLAQIHKEEQEKKMSQCISSDDENMKDFFKELYIMRDNLKKGGIV